MIANFRIVSGATVPYLEVVITKDGIIPLHMQAPAFGCSQETDDPNVLDLTEVQSVQFKMFKCGRTPQEVGLSGVAEKLQSTVNGKIINKGVVIYKWHPNDTVVKGMYYGQFTLTFSNNVIYKFPFQLESLSIEVS